MSVFFLPFTGRVLSLRQAHVVGRSCGCFTSNCYDSSTLHLVTERLYVKMDALVSTFVDSDKCELYMKGNQ